MPSILNTLNIGYTGLSASQVGIDVTGHNITNAETDGYTRQRVMQSAATPISERPGQVGNGVEIQNIQRVFDNFVFDRYSDISADKEYSDFEKQTLEELSTYFPEIDNVGIKADLKKYYDMWQTFSDNPGNDSIKVALAKQTETLSDHIRQTQDRVRNLQNQVNEQLAVDIKQVNSLAKQLAELNIQIDTAEAGDSYSANDLRDKRNTIERSLSRLVGANVKQGQLEANIQVNSNSNVRTGSYTLSINGFNIVDGSTYHPLKLNKDDNEYGFYSVSYERQDGVLIPMEEKIDGGRVGAIFDLRGGAIDTTSGMPTDGILQKTVAELDAFAKGLIESTNNLYAHSASTDMMSNSLDLDGKSSLVGSNYNINEGSFAIVVYDIDGNEVSKRDINIDLTTTMTGTGNSIKDQIEANTDDNGDSNANNDLDDVMQFGYTRSADGQLKLELRLSLDAQAKGYKFSIQDNLKDGSYASGTNFAGALGLGRFLDGNNARNIDLNYELRRNPTKLHAGYSTPTGDNRVALSMVQQQFEKYNFKIDTETYNSTIPGMFDVTSTEVGIVTNSAVSRNETISTQYNATKTEYDSVTKVNIDEEMTNLIRYQTAYGASAKLITTVDQMMQTLLGIKS